MNDEYILSISFYLLKGHKILSEQSISLESWFKESD